MPDTITVRSLTVFEDSATGKWVNPGDEIEATEARAAELMANGLVEKATRGKVIRGKVESRPDDAEPGIQIDGQGLPPAADESAARNRRNRG